MAKKRKRKYIEDVLGSTNQSLRWLWLLVMGAALVQTIYLFYDTLFGKVPTTIILYQYAWDQTWISTIPYANLIVPALLFFIYIPTFIRFYYGDNRYLDLNNLRLSKLIEEDDQSLAKALRQFSGFRRFFDIWALLLHGIVFIFLARSIVAPEIFAVVFGSLIFINVIWLVFSVRANIEKTQERVDEADSIITIYKALLNDRAPKIWAWINSITLVVLSGIYYIYLSNTSILGIKPFDFCFFAFFIVCCANSFIDFNKTWFFYFPDLDALGTTDVGFQKRFMLLNRLQELAILTDPKHEAAVIKQIRELLFDEEIEVEPILKCLKKDVNSEAYAKVTNEINKVQKKIRESKEMHLKK